MENTEQKIVELTQRVKELELLLTATIDRYSELICNLLLNTANATPGLTKEIISDGIYSTLDKLCRE